MNQPPFFLFPLSNHSSMSATRTCEYCGSIGIPDGNGGTKKLRKCGRCYRIRYCNREHIKRITNDTNQIAWHL